MADQKITQLTEDTAPTTDDLVVTVQDPGGTPVNRKVSLANLMTAVNMKYPYKFLAYRNAAQNTGNGAFAIINFDTEIYDTGGNFDVATNVGRFVAPVAGFYQFDAVANITTSAKDILITLYKNGSVYAYGSRGQSSTNHGVFLSMTVQAAANDYFEIYTFCSATAAYDVGASPIKTWFGGKIISVT